MADLLQWQERGILLLTVVEGFVRWLCHRVGKDCFQSPVIKSYVVGYPHRCLPPFDATNPASSAWLD
jgi:hypothetical protein